jgi:3-dehydroquinate dehydratase II
MLKPIHVLNGPNLNMLGLRESAICRAETFAGSCHRVEVRDEALGPGVLSRRLNHQGEPVGRVQEARRAGASKLLNPGAGPQPSLASMDSVHVGQCRELRCTSPPPQSYISPAAHGEICRFGAMGHQPALEAREGGKARCGA